MNLTIEDFYRIGLNAVQLSPVTVGQPCKQLQTWRVLQKDRGGDVATPNLGAVPTDKDGVFFWSRKWHNNNYNPNALEFEFPLLTAFEISSESLNSSAFKRYNVAAYTVEFSVLDTYQEDCTTAGMTGCKARPINQIYIDTRNLLKAALEYYGASVVATTSADATEKVYALAWLDNEKTAGRITSYDVKHDIGGDLTLYNKEVGFYPVEIPAQNIYGTKCRVTFHTTTCNPVQYDLALPDFGSVAFESGCKDCG